MAKTNHKFAAIFVHHQHYCQLFPLGEALKNGTIFTCLNQPYIKQVRK